MDQNIARGDILPATVPTTALWLLALAGLAVWVIVHRLVVRRVGNRPLVRLAILVPVGMGASWLVLQLMARYLFLASPTHLLLMALLAGAAVEVVSFLYSHESSRLPGRRGAALVACRLAALLAIFFMLLQPVRVGEKTRTIRRRVVVLVDDSASMQFVDRHWTLAERLQVAAALGLLNADGPTLDSFARDVAAFAERFAVFREIALTPGMTLERLEVGTAAGEARAMLERSAETMEGLAKKISAQDHFELHDNLGRVARHIRESLLPGFEKLVDLAAEEGGDLKPLAIGCADALDQVAQAAPSLVPAGGIAAFDGLDESARAAALAASDTNRAAIAARLLHEKGSRPRSLIDHLRSRYDVDIYRFGALARYDSGLEGADAEDPATEDDASAARLQAFRSATDITAAIETALKDIPPEELAGFLLLTDGRHNGDAGVDAVARRLGGAGIPVSSILIGGSRPPVDVALGDVRSPDSVFLGDKIRITGSLVATGAAGRETTVRLMLGEDMIEEQTVFIENNDFAREFRFTHLPEEKGVLRYRVVVDAVPDEAFADNNAWSVDVSVTDDRTNVLLVDSRPRWEFRYLRNLFYGRDKSVHLQEYLIHPDRVEGQPEDRLPPASASRRFGDSESGDYPRGRDEWRKFDAIILGDLPPAELPDAVVEDIRYTVEERGALLVVIAGPEAMPHRIRNTTLLDMLPVVVSPADGDRRMPPEPEFHLRLAPAGRGHPVMMQSSSSYENESIWDEAPVLRWRQTVEGVKPGAEVLAYAAPVDAEPASAAQLAVREIEEDPEAAVRRLAEMRETQARNALVVARSFGQGKVLMLNTDQTWRLRYRVGDTRHHRFWGQVLRWGAGEKLRAGNTFVRLGTDKLRYKPTEPVRVFARISDAQYNAINGLKPTVALMSEDRVLKMSPLEFRRDSNGLYEGMLDPIPDPGVYALVFQCEPARRALGGDFPEGLKTQFVVVTADKPAEFVDVTVSRDVVSKLATITGGRAGNPTEIPEMWDAYGEGNRVMHERTELLLWNSGLLFLLAVGLLTAEWLVRKRAGIA
ncbi:MAG: hypothetical protein ACOX9C_11295 [Kiritimatiellia bacterium]|jgi:hypothetical protein